MLTKALFCQFYRTNLLFCSNILAIYLQLPYIMFNKRAKMALNRSPEYTDHVTLQEYKLFLSSGDSILLLDQMTL